MPRKTIWLQSLLIWCFVSIFTTSQLFLKTMQAGAAGTWLGIFKVQLLVWLLWGLLTPLIYWLALKFTISRDNLFSRLLIHLPISVTIVILYLAAYSVIWNLDQYGSVGWDSFYGIGMTLFLNLFHWHFFIYIAIVGVVHAHLYLTASRDEKIKNAVLEKELLTSKLNFLKMQLQPHFLFNTLNSIVSSIHQKKPTAAATMTTELSELLRLSLAENNQQITLLKNELKYVKMYLNIEKHRFKNLKIDYQIPDHLLAVEVPHFFLQPIVENAIKHGISKQKKAEHIKVSAKKINGQIKFTVYNDGPPVANNNDGIGLSNLKRRLRTIYQSLGQFKIYPTENGTTAEVIIPV